MAAIRPPSLCIVRNKVVEYVGYVDVDEIPNLLSGLGVETVAIDSPFTLPSTTWREVDLIGKKAGFKLLPPSWRGMRKLVLATMSLLHDLKKRMLIDVIEVFPGGVDFECTFRYVHHKEYTNKDFKDACISAAVAIAYRNGEVLVVHAEDGDIFFPSLCFKRIRAPRFGPSSFMRIRGLFFNKPPFSHRHGVG